MAPTHTLKRTNSIADNMPNALRKSRYHMKKCFAKYLEKGRRIMKLHELMEEVERTIDDKNERNYVLEGNLGFILSSTQVLFIFCLIGSITQIIIILRFKLEFTRTICS